MNDMEMIIVIIIDIIIYGVLGLMWWLVNKMDTTYLVEPTSSGWRLVTSIRTWPNNDKLSYKNHTYPINANGIIDRGKIIRCINYVTGKQLTWEGHTELKGLSPKELDVMVGGHFLRDALNAMRPTSFMNILLYLLPVIFLIAGVIIGWLLASSTVQPIIIENIK